jgi:hypothetical protein
MKPQKRVVRETKPRKAWRRNKTIHRIAKFAVVKNGWRMGTITVELTGEGVDQKTRARIRQWFSMVNFTPLSPLPKQNAKKNTRT